MAKLNFTVSNDFDSASAESARASFAEHLAVCEPNRMFRRSADPNLISIVRLIGDVSAWLPLSAAATIFLSTLAKHAGGATWEWLRSLFKRKDVKPLADVTTALAVLANKADGQFEIAIGLDIPDDHFGTTLSIRSRDQQEIARRLAIFVKHSNRLAEIMEAEMRAGRTPIGGASVEVLDDGSLLVRWLWREDGYPQERQRHIR